MSIYFNERDFNTTNYDELKVIKLVSNRHHINNNFTIIPEEGGLINDLTIEENILLGHHHKNIEDLFSIKFSTKTINLNIIRNTFRFKNTIYQHAPIEIRKTAALVYGLTVPCQLSFYVYPDRYVQGPELSEFLKILTLAKYQKEKTYVISSSYQFYMAHLSKNGAMAPTYKLTNSPTYRPSASTIRKVS